MTIISGAEDLVVNCKAHSKRLHEEVAHSRLVIVPDTGHMVHYAAPHEVVAAVERDL